MKYKDLPDRMQEILAKKHTHAELCKEGDVVYKEKDLIDIYYQEINRDWTPMPKLPEDRERQYIFCAVTLSNNVVREAMFSMETKQFTTESGIQLTKKVIAWMLMPKNYEKKA